MTTTIELTAAQAMMRWLSVQMTEEGERFIEGVWAIFGHGNVAGIGEALHGIRKALPTWRGQNEQTMAHAAIAYAKTKRRRRAHAVTSSIGPGATNMVTAAALAHVNRLPVLFIPGDVFANRRPDPVLQQIEDFDDGTVSANDCFRPVSRYFDRLTRPEHLLTALPRAMRTLTDPANCGPVTLAFCQDVQAEIFEYPESFFEPKVWRIRRPEPDKVEVEEVMKMIKAAKKPVILSGGGVLYSGADDLLADFAVRHNIPLVETQAGKGALEWEHEMNYGSPGVTGSACANEICEDADLVIGVGTRFQDFTTGSWTLFANPDRKLVSINLHGYDAQKHGAVGVVGDARVTLEMIEAALGDVRFDAAKPKSRADWHATVAKVTAPPPERAANALPTDAQVIGAVQRVATKNTVVMCAAGTMPGALQILWQSAQGRLSHGIRLFLHGLRGGWRDGRQARRAGKGSDLLRRRRKLHAGELGAGDSRYAAGSLHCRAHRQSGVRLHQPAADRMRRGRVQQHVQGQQRRGAARDRLRGPRGRHGRACREGCRH